MVAYSPPGQPVPPVLVRAGMTAGRAPRDGEAPSTGPLAIVVAREAQRGLRDVTWVPESDTEYDDFDVDQSFTLEDLAGLEKTTRQIIKGSGDVVTAAAA